MSEQDELIPFENGIPRPDWVEIAKRVETLPELEWPNAWNDWAKKWVEMTAESHPAGYRIVESKNFLVMSSEPDKYVNLLIRFLEKALSGINEKLRGIASSDGYGKSVVLIFSEQEEYYRYMSYFYPEEGEFVLSSGVFLNTEYGHFTFPYVEMYEAEATAAHELTHACLRHLPIPVWLNEGLAVTIEDEFCGSQPLRMEKERLSEHREFWDSETIQQFWNGTSFNRIDEGSSLSYELARYCVRALAHDYDDFTTFANEASYEDGGEKAAHRVYGGSLGDLIDQFFGAGEWSPNPNTWRTAGAS